MSIRLTHVKPSPPEGIDSRDFETGRLYLLAKGGYSTIYTRATNGDIIWFDNDKAGIVDSDKHEKFILAPAGTQVLLKN